MRSHRGRPVLMAAGLVAVGLVAQAADDGFPKGKSFVIELTSTQASSGLGEYLVPPLHSGMTAAGLRYDGGPGADYVATVEPSSDVGSWHQVGGEQVWLYLQSVTVGLSPASMDVVPEGRLAPAFAVRVELLTDNADRDDQLECLIRLGVRVLRQAYRPEGAVRVDGSRCEK
ncbi:MAG: hypothetical protein RLZZ528_2630 [Pseudomonadota bacterium]